MPCGLQMNSAMERFLKRLCVISAPVDILSIFILNLYIVLSKEFYSHTQLQMLTHTN